MRDSYIKALHLANNNHPVADAVKNSGMSKTAFYRYKHIAELQIVDREHFSNLFDLAVSRMGPGEAPGPGAILDRIDGTSLSRIAIEIKY